MPNHLQRIDLDATKLFHLGLQRVFIGFDLFLLGSAQLLRM